MGVPQFNPDEPFTEVPPPKGAGTPEFDPDKPFTEVKAKAEPPASFQDRFRTTPPSETPVPSGQESDTEPPVAGALPSRAPLPRARPKEAPGIVQPTQPIPPVQPLEDTGKFRVPGVSEAGGSQEGMLTGEEGWQERQDRIAGARQNLTDAQNTLNDALRRQREEPPVSKTALGEMKQSPIDAEVEAAQHELTRAQQGLSAAERTGIPTMSARRSAAAGFAQTVGTGIPEMLGGAVRPIDAALGTTAGDWLQRKAEDIALANPTDPTRKDEWTQSIASGGGSMVPFAVTGTVARVGGLASEAAGRVVAGVSGALQNAEQFYRDAVAEEEKAKQFGGQAPPAWKKGLAYLMGAAIGSTEAAGLGSVAGRVGTAERIGRRAEGAIDRATGRLKGYTGEVLGEFGEEAGQEWTQQVLQNAAEQQLYGRDPGEYGVFTGAGGAAAVGGILGAGVGGAAHAPSLVVGGHAAEGKVPIPDTGTVTADDIANLVQTGQVPVHTGAPVTTVDGGVVTTTTLHGPADTYVVDPTDPNPTPHPLPPMAASVDTPESIVRPDGVVMSQDDILRTSQMQATPEELKAAEGIGISEPAIRQFGEEAPSTPVMGLYSRLHAWVQERGPLNATAARWISQLKKGDFRKEELADLRVPEFLAGREGKVSKGELLDYITAMTAPMVEVTRTPLTREMRVAEEQRLNAQIAAVARAHPEAIIRRPDGGMEFDLNHPLISPLVDELANLNRNVKWARYEEYTTPGPRQSYTELTLHLPQRDVGTVPAPHGEVIHDPEGDRQYPFKIVIDGQEINRAKNERGAHRELRDEVAREQKNRQKRMEAQANFKGGHYVTPNEIVTIRLTTRLNADGKLVAVLEEMQSDLHQTGKRLGYAAETEDPGAWKNSFHVRPEANIPYKEGWAQLGFTRALMWAAQNGITEVAWTSGEEQVRRYPGGTEQQMAQRQAGMHTFYNRTVTAFAKKWARKLGGTVMYTSIPGESPFIVQRMPMDMATGASVWAVIDPAIGPRMPVRTFPDQSQAETFVQAHTPQAARFRVLSLPSSALETIQQGMPSYAMSIVPPSVPVTGPGAQFGSKQQANKDLVKSMQPLVDALNHLIKKLGLGVNVNIVMHAGTIKVDRPDPKHPGKTIKRYYPKTFGLATTWHVGGVESGAVTRAQIDINVPMHANAAQVWATMVHELGHVVMKTIYRNASVGVRTAVQAAYDMYRANVGAKSLMKNVVGEYVNPVVAATTMKNFGDTMTLDQLSAKDQAYWSGFSEWFAEQVATWATTNSKPLSLVDKFFAGLAKTITNLLQEAKKMLGYPYEGVKELNEFLNSFLDAADQMWGHDVNVATQQQGVVKNAPQMGPEEKPAPQQPETVGVKDGIGKAFDGRPPREVQETNAYMDKFNWLYKWFTAIHQLALKNPHITALQEYVETVRIAQLTKQQIMIRAQEVLKMWNKLGRTQADAVSALLDDVQHMTYRTPQEIKNRVARHPTQAELLAMAQKHGVSRAGLAVFAEVTKSFQEFLDRYEAVLRTEAGKITDATRQQLKMAAITKQIAALKSKPYFPSMRFGSYTLTIRDAAKKVIHFETFETKRERERAAESIRSRYGVPVEQMQLGLLDKTARPLLGVPTELLDMMAAKLNLSATARDALEQLKFELSPAQSFQHRFQHKRRVAGYSMDFRRAYASYFFHGANHLMKAKYADRMRALAKMARDEVDLAPDITKREGIKAFMVDHLENWLDPKSDWASIRSIASLYGLSFVPSAAAQNLTQTLLTTYPHLAHAFGDVSATRALLNAGRKFETFYRKGSLNQSNFETKAIYQGMQDGIIKETQAPELAGYADGNVLGLGFGGNILQRSMVKFNEMGMFMFEMAEQINRRLAFRAALQLAMEQPNAKYVKEAVARRNLTYELRRKEGWTEAEATAYVVAMDATVHTQFQYSREFAPRILRGKMRSVLVFKTFIHSYIVFLTHNPGTTIRSLLILGALGGLMGMPFADDLEGLIEALAYQLFGKDFKLSHEIRKWIVEHCKTEETGNDVAELALHGIARKGYGIPWLMDQLGGTVGVDIPMPTFDRSAAISAGTILPVELGKLFGPTKDVNANIAQQSQKASGAVFGLAFSMYKAMMNTQLDAKDFKRWEGIVPRAVADVSKAYRAWTEGGMRTNTGSQIVKYDVRDPEQMMEVIGMSMGYTPYRQNYEWEKALSKADGVKFWDIQREGLMRQFGNATLGKDKEEKTKVLEAIRQFNKDLPSEAKGKAITGDALQTSVENRAKNRVLQEKGLPSREADVPLFRAEDKIYPRSMRELRKVQSSMTPR
jgi:hypothetical protein